MTCRSAAYGRRSIRLRGYDYAQPGAYFVTTSTQHRECVLGEIAQGAMKLNAAGAVVQDCWDDLPRHFPHVELDAFVVMPNHVHGIIVLTSVGAGFKPAPTKRHPLPQIVRAFKTFAARRINEHRGTPGVPVWQRNYYEHVVRNDDELNRIRQYILDNPMHWALDRENPRFPGVGAGFKPAPTDGFRGVRL